jgi:aspartate/glutamate racemase
VHNATLSWHTCQRCTAVASSTHTRTTIYPSPEEQAIITDIMYAILSGTHSQYHAEELVAIIQHAEHTHHIDSVILGCTELPILYRAVSKYI